MSSEKQTTRRIKTPQHVFWRTEGLEDWKTGTQGTQGTQAALKMIKTGKSQRSDGFPKEFLGRHINTFT